MATEKNSNAITKKSVKSQFCKIPIKIVSKLKKNRKPRKKTA